MYIVFYSLFRLGVVDEGIPLLLLVANQDFQIVVCLYLADTVV